MPKLLIVSTVQPGYGGTQRAIMLLARGLSARGISVRTVFPPGPDADQMKAWYLSRDVRVEYGRAVKCVLERRSPRDVMSFRSLIRHSAADVVSLQYGTSYASFKDVLAVRLAGKPCVVTIHHAAELDDRHKIRMTRLAAALAKMLVVDTEHSARFLHGLGVPRSKIRVIHLGIEEPEIRPDKESARSRLGVPRGVFLVATLTRLVPHKNISGLIMAMSHLRTGGMALHLAVGGEGPERANLEAHAERRLPGGVTFLGHLDETADLYAAADVFALPSLEEGFGLVFVEAALHGVPSVGGAVGGVPEAIVDDQTGILVPPTDTAALAHALRRLHHDPAYRRRLGESARDRALSRFTVPVMARAYERVLFPNR